MDALVTSEGNRILPLLAQMHAVIFWKGWVKFCPCLRRAERDGQRWALIHTFCSGR